MRQVVSMARIEVAAGKEADSLPAQGLTRQAALVGLVGYGLPPYMHVAR